MNDTLQRGAPYWFFCPQWVKIHSIWSLRKIVCAVHRCLTGLLLFVWEAVDLIKDSSLYFVPFAWIITLLRGWYHLFASFSVWSWNNWFRVCSQSSGWFFMSSTCACGTGIVFVAFCGVNSLKIATATYLMNVYVWLLRLVICSIVFTFVMVTSAGEIKIASFSSNKGVASTAPFVGA